MYAFVVKTFWTIRSFILCVAVLASGIMAAYVANTMSKSTAAPATENPPGQSDSAQAVKVKRFGPDGIVLPADTVTKMGLNVAVVLLPTRPIRLPPFQGVLALDNERLSRVRSRFPGEVMEIGRRAEGSTMTPFQVGDRVRIGDLLAVVWSKDLGEKKNELLDALSRLKLDRDNLVRYKSLTEGVIALKQIREAEAAVRSSENAVAKAESTLRAWQLGDDEIESIAAKADTLGGSRTGRDLTTDRTWARVEVRASQDGVILEKNVAARDIIDMTTTLFVIGDISRLTVWAHVYEEDLALLQALPQPIRWTVALPSRHGATFPGTLSRIGAVIDPAQHTALVCGSVENPAGDLKAGQSVTVTVELPQPSGELELPATAVVEDGRESVVFVEPNPHENRFVRRSVSVVRRFREVIYVRASNDGVHAGDRVVTSGSLLLRQALDQLPTPVVN